MTFIYAFLVQVLPVCCVSWKLWGPLPVSLPVLPPVKRKETILVTPKVGVPNSVTYLNEIPTFELACGLSWLQERMPKKTMYWDRLNCVFKNMIIILGSRINIFGRAYINV